MHFEKTGVEYRVPPKFSLGKNKPPSFLSRAEFLYAGWKENDKQTHKISTEKRGAAGSL